MTLLIIVFGGLMVAHVITSFGESLIGKGALELERPVLNRIIAREVKNAIFWKTGETVAIIVMFAGLIKIWGHIKQLGTAPWGIPAVALGFSLFCIANIVRAWICRAAYESEAPGSKASRGAMVAGVLTTLAEFAVAFAVCAYIYSHLPKTRATTTTPDPVETVTSENEPAKLNPDAPPPTWVNADDALKILKDRNMDYLKAIAARKDIRSHQNEKGATEYHRDDLVKLKRDGMPTWDELELKNPNPDNKRPDAGD